MLAPIDRACPRCVRMPSILLAGLTTGEHARGFQPSLDPASSSRASQQLIVASNECFGTYMVQTY